MVIAILSDTHNLVRREVLDQIAGCDAVLHGGDVSRPEILRELEKAAPVHAVRGNNDKDWADPLPVCIEVEMGGLRICMAHKKKDLPEDLSGYDVAVCGHTHQFSQEWIPGRDPQRRTLLLNPGSCGPRRFHQPITMAMLRIDPEGWVVTRVEIPHQPRETAPAIGADIRRQIETVIRETDKGRSPEEIARRTGMEKALAEQIARLYVTHPGVTADGIMTKLGL